MRRCRIESLGVSAPGKRLFGRGSLAHAVRAGKQCLKASRLAAADVQVLVNSGVHRDEHVCEPAIATYVQAKLGINPEFRGRRTLAFDLMNGACGMLNAAHLVSALLQAGEIHAGMVVSSEANSDSDPDPSYTYAESGAALLLDLSPRAEVGFGPFAFHTREEHLELLESAVSLAVKHGRLSVRRRADELEQAFVACAAVAAREALAADGLGIDDIDLVVPAQVSRGFVGRLPEVLGASPERVLDLTASLPDTHSTSVFVAFERALRAGRLSPGKRALLVAVGAGVTAGAVTYRL